MANQIKKVSISVMKASNGIFFYTTLVNDQGVHMELFDTEILAQAVHSADELAEFFGIEAERLKPLLTSPKKPLTRLILKAVNIPISNT